MGNTEIIIGVGAAAAAVVAYAGNIGGFRAWADSLMKGSLPSGPPTSTGSCDQLCARQECSTYFGKCGTKPCAKCGCSNLCASAQCQTLKAAGCSLSACPRCEQISGTIRKLSNNCAQIGKYTMWKGAGCLNGKLMQGLEYTSIGTCAQIRAQFLLKYKCGAKQAFAYQGFDNVTVA